MISSTRFIVTLLFALICTARVLVAQDQPNYYAVVIGVSEFAHLPQHEWLEFADADARDFYDFIISPRGRAFPPENIYLLTNEDASYQAIRRRLGSTLAKKVKADDTVYIFIATHGMVERGAAREAYLLAHDSDREDIYSSALQMSELGNIIQNRLQKARRIVLFADACRAGKLGQVQGMVNRYIEDVGRQRGETFGLLASRPNEFSREGKQFGGGHGVFTYYLLKGLMGEADTDGDKTVTAAEIVSYLQDEVEDATDRQQHVRDFGNFEPDTPLAFVDKPPPPNLKLTSFPQRVGTEIASLRVMQAESVEVHAALQDALREGRLLAPSGNNAWDLYQRYTQFPVPQSDLEAVEDDLFIAFASAGDEVLWAYRRGDQVIPLDAAKYEEGAQLFALASRMEPGDATLQSKAKFMAGRAMVENRRFAEGISELREAIALDPAAAYSYNALGIAYMEQQEWNEAIENFRAATERAEKWVYPHYNRARVYAGLERYREAEQELARGIELESELGLRYPYLHYNLGIIYLYQGRNDEAEQQFRQAIEMQPDDAKSYHNLGLIFEARGNTTEAENYFRRAAELDAQLVESRLKLAEIYREQRRLDQEEAILREAVEGDPPSAVALKSLGQLLLASRRLDEAEQVFLNMLANRINLPEALEGLGDVHAAQGNFDQAVEDYRQAIARSTDQEFLRNLQRKLRSVEERE